MCCQRKMKETSCLLGAEPVAGKSTVRETIYLCKNLPVTDSPGAQGSNRSSAVTEKFPSDAGEIY